MPAEASASFRSDLVGRERFDLHDLVDAVGLRHLDHDGVRLGRVTRPVHGAARSADGRLELGQVALEVRKHVGLDATTRLAELLPVGELADHTRTLRLDRVRRSAQVRAQLRVSKVASCGLRKRLELHAAPVEARISARWIVRVAERAATDRRRSEAGRSRRARCRSRRRSPRSRRICRRGSPRRSRRSSPRTSRRSRSTRRRVRARRARARARSGGDATVRRRRWSRAASDRSGGRQPGAGTSRRRLPRRGGRRAAPRARRDGRRSAGRCVRRCPTHDDEGDTMVSQSANTSANRCTSACDSST